MSKLEAPKSTWNPGGHFTGIGWEQEHEHRHTPGLAESEAQQQQQQQQGNESSPAGR